MNVPLTVRSEQIGDKEKLIIWRNGKKEIIDSPVYPFFYTYDKFDTKAIRVTKVKGVALSNYQERTFHKYEFQTIRHLTAERDRIYKQYGRDKVFEAHIQFILRNRLENKDLYTKYPHTKELKFLFLDIEQYCPDTLLFPTINECIISISWCTNDRQIKCIYLKKESNSDKKLLEKFIEEYKKIDPDVVVGYYHTGYDMPMIMERCKINKIDIKQFAKSDIAPRKSKREGVVIDGVCLYDLAASTASDQSLNGEVTTRGLKEVSNFFGFKETVAPIEGSEISNYIGTPELVQYNKDDIRRSLLLFDVYWNNITYNAEDLQIPLDVATNIKTANLGIIVIGDLYKERNIISDGSNVVRYPQIFSRKRSKDESNYQGALTLIKKHGLFKPVLKADYSSMYPSVMSAFNLSPDVCTLLRYEPYKKNGFKIEEDEDTFTYFIPDDQINKIVVIQTLKQEGFYSKVISKLLEERAEFKKIAKKTGDKSYKSKSWNRKVKANGAIYGNQGNTTHPFGFGPAAVGTTGIGRECAKLLVDVLETLYPKSTIEVDTDGIYFDAENYNEERIITYFEEKLKAKFKKDLKLDIDVDEYQKGFFHKIKNYILLTKKGDIILHGAAIKASSKDNISRKLINELAKAKLNSLSTVPIINKYKNLTVDDFELREFAMQVTMGKRPNQYTERGKSHVSFQMALRALHKFNLPMKMGNEYHYIKTVHGYELYQLTKKEEIDIKYYRKKVKKILDMFKAEYESVTPLTEFMGRSSSSWDGDIDTIVVKERPSKLSKFF